MTENTTAAPPKAPRVVKHRDEKIKDLGVDIAELQAKIAKKNEQLAALQQEADNEAAITNLKEGDGVSYVFGRAATRRIRSGVVRAVSVNDKGITMLKVETGEGFESEFNIIDASGVLLTAEQVEAEQARIDAAVAEAKAAADAEAAKGGAA